jgi:uncharacterized protein YjbJ (UPF0337 family)
MNTQRLKGNWNTFKGRLKQQFASLTDDDLQYSEGKEDELVGRIQRRLGKSRDAVERMLDNL